MDRSAERKQIRTLRKVVKQLIRRVNLEEDTDLSSYFGKIKEAEASLAIFRKKRLAQRKQHRGLAQQEVQEGQEFQDEEQIEENPSVEEESNSAYHARLDSIREGDLLKTEYYYCDEYEDGSSPWSPVDLSGERQEYVPEYHTRRYLFDFGDYDRESDELYSF